ncbi:DUF2157 domain-containing protein [Hymenobacter sp. HMF4947]|uniref:DUF2157 domain-containing protein n=1 Tax=Hymenobacter ginkgonis TaxID=2682976 RepID=A0A7K1TI30_9BACT|nr:DUF2157 domain-containing protein [Hymenobacter ginkgonis]MVN77976.1 DUF2157 domain-containing protein [Hymenobacter ginkgonis]
MTDSPTPRLLAELVAQGLLPPAQAAAIGEDERTRPFSLHYELRALLYLGITLLVGGVGVLVYQHIDSIGHSVIIGAITVAMGVSFAYAARHRPAFTWGEAPRTSIAADYLLLLSCLLFLVLEGYLQVQYGVFGNRYGLVTVLPAGLFFYLAYRFDHRGVLSMAITALAAWVGVSVAPLALFTTGFPTRELSGAGLGLGLVLLAAGLVSERLRRKPHFGYTYMLLGSNVALLAAMVRLFDGGSGTEPSALGRALLVALLVLGVCTVLVWYARRTQSYVFLLLAVGYGYVAFTSALVILGELVGVSSAFFELAVLYFPLSLIGLAWLLINIKKVLRLT